MAFLPLEQIKNAKDAKNAKVFFYGDVGVLARQDFPRAVLRDQRQLDLKRENAPAIRSPRRFACGVPGESFGLVETLYADPPRLSRASFP